MTPDDQSIICTKDALYLSKSFKIERVTFERMYKTCAKKNSYRKKLIMYDGQVLVLGGNAYIFNGVEDKSSLTDIVSLSSTEISLFTFKNKVLSIKAIQFLRDIA